MIFVLHELQMRGLAAYKPHGEWVDDTDRGLTMASPGVFSRIDVRLVLLPPVVIGLIIGIGQFGSVRFESRLIHAGFGVVSLLLSWLAMEGFSALGARLLRPLRVPLWVPLLGGVFMAGLLHAPFTLVRDAAFSPFLRDGSHFFQAWPWAFDNPVYLKESAIAFANRSLVWLPFNYLLIHGLGLTRFGHDVFLGRPGAAGGVAALPEVREIAAASEAAGSGIDLLFQKLPAQIGREIICLKAQEHYTEVVTRLGSAMIYMRFSDAMALASSVIEGAQIHRSYWVAQDAVLGLERADGKLMLQLAGGDALPVSRTYQHHMPGLTAA